MDVLTLIILLNLSSEGLLTAWMQPIDPTPVVQGQSPDGMEGFLASPPPITSSLPWPALEEALLARNTEGCQTALLAFPEGEPRTAAMFVVNLIEDGLDHGAIESYLSAHFAPTSTWTPRLRRLAGRLDDPSLVENNGRTPGFPLGALGILESESYAEGLPSITAAASNGGIQAVVDASPELDFIKLCRLERQLIHWNHQTLQHGHRLVVKSGSPLELGFRWYKTAEDAQFLNSEINERLRKLGSPWSCYFAQSYEASPLPPLKVHLWPFAQRTQFVPDYPFRSMKVPGVVTEGLLVVVDVPTLLGGVLGVTDPLGGGVSFIFRDRIRSQVAPILADWPRESSDPTMILFPKMWEVQKQLHGQLRQAYRGAEQRLLEDSIELTTHHELAHQACHDLLGRHVTAASKLDFGPAGKNVMGEGIEILADLAVLHHLVERRDPRLTLLAAYEGVDHGWSHPAPPGLVVAAPYGWKGVILVSAMGKEPEVIEFDFDRIQAVSLAIEHHLLATMLQAYHHAVLPALIEFLVAQGRIPGGPSFEESVPQVESYVATCVGLIRAGRANPESHDVEIVAMHSLLYEMAIADPHAARAMQVALARMTPELHRDLALLIWPEGHDAAASQAAEEVHEPD